MAIPKKGKKMAVFGSEKPQVGSRPAEGLPNISERRASRKEGQASARALRQEWTCELRTEEEVSVAEED